MGEEAARGLDGGADGHGLGVVFLGELVVVVVGILWRRSCHRVAVQMQTTCDGWRRQPNREHERAITHHLEIFK